MRKASSRGVRDLGSMGQGYEKMTTDSQDVGEPFFIIFIGIHCTHPLPMCCIRSDGCAKPTETPWARPRQNSKGFRHHFRV